MKKFVYIMFVFIIVFSLSACLRMPFNGEIVFHDISLTVPERFVRDSTQSDDDLWVFEHDNYSEYIIISHSDITSEVKSALTDYSEYMKENGAESEKTFFLDNYAVLSTYYKDNKICYEILFAYNDCFYAVALRGGTQDGFDEITDTVSLIALSDDVAS